jgi:uncharacterized membrane protein
VTLTQLPTSSGHATWRTRTAFWWILLSAVAIVALALLPYITSSLQEQTTADSHAIAASYADGPVALQVAFYLHVGFAGLALLLSPLQFATRLRTRVPRLHRAVGRIAFGSIGIAGSAGLVLAPNSQAGWIGTAGFGTLAVLWLVFAAAAFRAIRRRDIAAHRRWAVRTFALTYGGVTLRLWLGVLVPIQMAVAGVAPQVAFDRAYLLVPFLGWVPNLVVAERYLRRRTPLAGPARVERPVVT